MMIRTKLLSLILLLAILFSACGAGPAETVEIESFSTWEEVQEKGQNQEVSILMWGGNESINQYMDGYVADNVKRLYGITLKRVPMNAPEFISKLVNEKKGGLNPGTADLIWINGENFRTARQGELLWGPFTHLLPGLGDYYDQKSEDLIKDAGYFIDGYEAIWGRAQLVFTYDSAVIATPLKTFGN
jgi:putative spermidine/putrescine transport system substrate-binding protein